MSLRTSSFSQRLRSLSFSSASASHATTSPPTYLTLSQVLQNGALKEQFKARLCALHTVEAIEFIENVDAFVLNPCKHVARRIIKQFCLEGSPQQVNLMCETKAELGRWLDVDEAPQLDMFSRSREEVIRDLRQSDAFRSFLATVEI